MKHTLTTLPSGLRIITIPLKDSPTATVLVMVEAGSKYETKEINGLSHFLEHMCFKGTVKRPTALSITHELDALGARSNAFTSHEFTGYYAKAEKTHVLKLLDIISDIYLNPVFDQKEIDKERGVVTEEINMYLDMPQRQIYDLFPKLLYGNQPAGWPIAGPKENIKRFSREDFIRYRSNHYIPQTTTVVIAGGFDEGELITQASKIFSSSSSAKKVGKESVKESQEKPAVLIEEKKTDQTHLMLGVRTYPLSSSHTPALKLLSAVLGGGMSSRLFQKLREKMGVAYYARAEAEFFTDHGYLSVATGVPGNRLNEVVAELISELKILRKAEIDAKELQKAKDYLTGTMYLDLESSDDIAEFYGYQAVMRKDIESPDTLVSDISAVNSKNLLALSQTIFIPQQVNLALIGSGADSTALEKTLSLL
ncbi:MAG: pitrilysin family protein [Patescibacteria group bacterium]